MRVIYFYHLCHVCCMSINITVEYLIHQRIAGDGIRLITLVEYINHGLETAVVQVHVLFCVYF